MLAALIAALRRGRDAPDPQRRPSRAAQIALVRRFSLIAAATVPVLLAAGLLGALIQIPDARGLVETDWGAAFIAKLVALLLLFSAAALNAVLLRPRSARGDARAERWFAPMMRIELALAAVVLVITAALTQLPSPVSALPDAEQRDNTITRTVGPRRCARAACDCAEPGRLQPLGGAPDRRRRRAARQPRRSGPGCASATTIRASVPSPLPRSPRAAASSASKARTSACPGAGPSRPSCAARAATTCSPPSRARSCPATRPCCPGRRARPERWRCH